MAVDKKFTEDFNNQIKVLENLRAAVDSAIGRAQANFNKVVKEGKSVKDVFGPGSSKQGSPARSQGGKDHHR
jgi:hypothetical protein